MTNIKIKRIIEKPDSLFYSWQTCRFGPVLVASDQNTIYYLSFYTNKKKALADLADTRQGSELIERSTAVQKQALQFIDGKSTKTITVGMRGTDFQYDVWKALLGVRYGTTSTYGKLAEKIKKPTAYRAVANATGSNRIAYLVPCHRIVRSDGNISGYKWGVERKKKMIEVEKNNN